MDIKGKTFERLGYKTEGSVDLVNRMNVLIASYHIHYQKLRNFHWNVTGKDFFDLHEKFEELYNFSKINIDDLAERIRVFGDNPMARLSDYLEHSRIAEPEGIPSPDSMVEEILSDFELLLSQMINVLEKANDIGDVSTIDLVNKMVKSTEKYYWMFTAWSKN